LRHLFHAEEILALRLGSLHNLHFYHRLMAQMRRAIAAGDFVQWKKAFFQKYQIKQNQSFTEE
jgi:queuine tRNA-ribosyltransferase